MVSVLILTKNEEQDLPGCLESVAWCKDIQVFDSYSDDRTLELALDFGANVTQRKFDNWASHQNWALKNISFKFSWVLYLDADERVSASLYESLQIVNLDSHFVAYNIQRRDFAWDGTWLKHSQISPYYLRLFRPEKIDYERLVNPVTVPKGPTSEIQGFIDHYPFSKGMLFWMQRHIGYADLEARMQLKNNEENISFSIWKAFTSKKQYERRYHLKGIFFKMPFRPIIKWIYMLFWRRAFLDGYPGLTYATLQAIYEYLIILKSRELRKSYKQEKI